MNLPFDSSRQPHARTDLRHIAEYLAARMIVFVLQTIPLSWSPRIARGFGWLLNDLFKVRGEITEENLRHVYPDRSPEWRHRVAREMWEHLLLMLAEIAQAPRKIHDTNWGDYVSIRDRKLMTTHFLDWRPTILVSGHFGNFELAVFITGVMGVPTYAIARPLDNPLLERWIKRYREALGQFILPTSGSSGAIQQVLDAGGMLALLGDQHAGEKGCWVEFLGRPASCHKAVALFTLLQDAPMLVSWCVRRDGPLKMEVGCEGVADPAIPGSTPGDVRSLTQWYNQKLEEVIRRDPEQYWWLHRRWKERPRRGSASVDPRGESGQSSPRAA
jgi:Kdo2-lipid IVA lauroyltransferase/acyltransferase